MKPHNAKEFASRRLVLPGYPKTEPFKSSQEVEQYYAQEHIVCLLCGKKYKSLAFHLAAIHGESTDAYRERYGLAYLKGLSCQESKSKRRANAIASEALKEGRAKGRELIYSGEIKKFNATQRTSLVKLRHAESNMATLPRKPKIRTQQEAASIVRSIVDKKVSLKTALRLHEPRMSSSTFWDFIKNDAGLREALNIAFAANGIVPTATLMEDKKFLSVLEQSLREGKSTHVVAKELNVSRNQVYRIGKRLGFIKDRTPQIAETDSAVSIPT